MIEQLNTIRDGLENFTEPYLQKALTALTQLEAMAGAQEPVACVGSYWNDGKGFDLCDFSGNRPAPGAKLYAAPVAQQPPHDHVAVTWDAARTRILAVTLQDAEGRVLCVIDEAPAQQQAKPHKPLFADLIAQHPGLREELLEMDKQPQAETVPDVRNLISQLENAAHNKGELFERHQGKGWPATASERFTRLRDETIPALRKQLLAAAPQQAEAVPDGWYITERRDGGTAKQWPLTEQQTLAVALPQQAEAVPSTHVMVPVEPTDEMIDAACEAVKNLYWVDFVRAYKAAIAQQKGASHE